MSKINLLPILTLSFFLFSLKSLAVLNPEYINWKAHLREFVIYVYDGNGTLVTKEGWYQNGRK